MNHFHLAVYFCLFLLFSLATVYSFIDVVFTKKALKQYTGTFFIFLLLFQVLSYPQQLLLLMFDIYVVRCVIWYHSHNFKNMKNTHGGVLILVKLQASACNITKINTPPWVFFTFLKWYKWYQIVQRTTYKWINGNYSS